MPKPVLCVICGYFDSGKMYILNQLHFDGKVEYLDHIRGMYTDHIDDFHSVENCFKSKRVCIIKPDVREQHNYIDFNVVGAEKKILYIFRHPGISWILNQHKLKMMSKGKEYSQLLGQYIIGLNKFFEHFNDMVGINLKRVTFEDFLSVKRTNRNVFKYMNVSSSLYTNKGEYFVEEELDQIKDSLFIVKQKDLDLIYSGLKNYMDHFEYERLTLEEIHYKFAQMMGYDSIIECIANCKKTIAVDLDGTLARYDGWKGISYIGELIPSVAEEALMKQKQGYEIAILTARAMDSRSIPIIRNWLRNNGLPNWRITNVKDSSMKEIWDDLAVHVKRNKGFE